MGLDNYVRKEIIGEGSFGKVGRDSRINSKATPPRCVVQKLLPHQSRLIL